MKYDEALPHYYNNNQRFLQKRLDPTIIKKTKIFEKAEIRWFCVDELLSRKKEFRNYFQRIVEKIVAQQAKIFKFIQKCQKPDIYSSEMDDTSTSSSSSSSNWDETTTKSTTVLDDTTTGEDMTTSSTTSTESASSSTSSPKTQKIYKNKRKNKKTKGRRKIKIM